MWWDQLLYSRHAAREPFERAARSISASGGVLSSRENLRRVIRAQNLGDELRKREFEAILQALTPGENVRALAPGEFRGRRGYLVATPLRVLFVHAEQSTFVTTIASPPEAALFLEGPDGSASFVFSSAGGEEITVDQIPRGHAEVIARCLTPRSENGSGPVTL